MRYQKGFVQVLLIVGIVAALAVIGFVFYRQQLLSKVTSLPIPGANQAQYIQGQAGVPQVKSASDLNKVSQSLDATDTTQIDAQLNALNSASGGF